MIFRLYACIFLLVANLLADYGLDTLALAKYPDLVAKSLPSGWWYGGFAETFGDAYNSFDKVNATKKPKGFRAQLIWSDSHTFGDKDIPKIITLSKKYNQLAIKYPDIKCEISPFCEHKLNNPDKYLDIAAKHAPNCTIVNTVWTGALSKKYKNEVHGNKKTAPRGKYNFSYDGQSSWEQNVEQDKKTYQKAEVFYFWVPQFNGRLKIKDKTPREKRKAWIDADQFLSTIYLANSKGVTNFPKEHIWKSHSDQHKTPKGAKESKPVFITPLAAKYDRVVLVKDNKVIAKLGDRSTYDEKDEAGNVIRQLGWRYYLNQFGYEVSKRSGVVTIRADGIIIGSVNPAFRDGDYR